MNHPRSLRLMLVGLLGACGLAVSTASASSALPPRDSEVGTIEQGVDAVAWHSGPIVTQTGTTCPGGNQAQQEMVKSYAGYFGPKVDSPPVGHTWYVRVHFAVVGNPCPSGTTIVGASVKLPSGVSVDSSPGVTHRCWYFSRETSDAHDVSSAPAVCPAPVQLSDGVWLGTRPLPSGGQFRIDVPVLTTRVHASTDADRLSATVTPSTPVSPVTAEPSILVPGGSISSPNLVRREMSIGEFIRRGYYVPPCGVMGCQPR